MAIYNTFKDEGIHFSPATSKGSIWFKETDKDGKELNNHGIASMPILNNARISIDQPELNMTQQCVKERRNLNDFLDATGFIWFKPSKGAVKIIQAAEEDSLKCYHFRSVIKPIVSKLQDLDLTDYNDYSAYQMFAYPSDVKRSDFNKAIKCLRNLKKNNVSLVI